MAEFRLGRVKFNWTGEWQPSKSYLIDDLIKFGGNSYVAVTNHTSVATTADFYTTDLAKWNVHVEGIANKGEWVTNTYYRVNDIVKFGNVQYRVTTAHTSAGTFIDLSKCAEYVAGFKAEGEWSISTQYQAGDVVNYNGSSYVALTTSLAGNIPPNNVAIGTDIAGKQWQVLADGLAGAAVTYVDGTYYRGQLAQYGGNIYRHKLGITTNVAPLAIGDTNNPGVGIGASVWDLLVQGFKFTGGYVTSFDYHPGHVARWGSDSYVAIGNSFKGIQPNTGIGTQWEVLASGDSSAALTTKGDILTFNSGNVRIGIGSTGYALAVQGDGLPGYEVVGAQTRVYYVDSESGHDQNNGLAPNLAFKTIKKACDAARPTTPVTGCQYTASTGLATITAPGHGLQNTGTFVQLAGLNFECTSGGRIYGVLGFNYTQTTGIATVTAINIGAAPETSIGATVRLRDIAVQYTTGGQFDHQYVSCVTDGISVVGGGTTTATSATYNQATGDFVVTIPNHVLTTSDQVGFNTNAFTMKCARDNYATNHSYPRVTDPAHNTNLNITATTGDTITVNVGASPANTTFNAQFANDFGESNFNVTAVPSNNSVAVDVGIKTYGITYTSGGVIMAGITTTIFPSIASKSFFEVLSVPSTSTFTCNVGVSTMNHTYVDSGTLTDLTPCVLRLSASQFYEQLPITVPPYTSIVGHSLRGTQVLPAAGTSDDNTTPNNRATMFRLSDSTTIQAMAFKGMEGFKYDGNAPFVLDNTNIRTGIGTTAAGVFMALNPNSPINDKSPYVKDCTAFSDNATENGRWGGGGVGVLIDGGVHDEGARSMVFDAFTHVTSDGAGYVLDKNAIAEIVSCFTYYAKWGYYSGGGSRIRAVGGNNSYGEYGVISSGFSTVESIKTARLFGDMMTIQAATIAGTVAVGQTMNGETSTSKAWIVNDQRSADKLYFKYFPGYGATASAATGNVAIGTSPFVDGEVIYTYNDASGAGYAGSFSVGAAASSVSGQKGTIVEVDNTSTTFLIGDAIGFSTTFGDDELYYIINTVTNVSTAVTYTDNAGLGVTFNNRATLTISPEKARATPDTRNTTGAGSTINARTRFSQVRLTGHDFLSVGCGNKTQTNYPDVDETNIIQGNETNTLGPGKVFFVSTDQGGNFRVGEFFSVDQLTGRATLDASAFNLSGLTELRLGAIGGQIGESINEFSSDEFLAGNSNSACPTEYAVKGFLTRGKMGVGAMVPPVGTTGQRPSGSDPSFVVGAMRYNTTIGSLEYYDGVGWTQPGKLTYNQTTANTNGEVNNVYFIDTTGGQVTITLPASPSIGDTIYFYDVAKTFDSNQLNVARNGKVIQGDSSDLTVSVEGAAFTLCFSGDTYGWRIFSI